jgi:nucleoside-diphosphate-sugar epimerase
VTRTLVTGASGFTGRYVGAILAEQGHELHGLVQNQIDEIPGYTKLHEGDLVEPEELRRVLSDVQPDHVVHLAAIAFVAHDDVDQIYRVNVVGTRHLLEALSKLNKKPDSILLASSANVYGNIREGILDETMPVAPANDYAVSKVAMEFVTSIYRPVLPLIIARPFNYTGRGQSSQFIIPKIISHTQKRLEIIELGNVDVARDFSDVRMIANAYARLVSTPNAIGGTFNVCSGQAVSLKQVLDLAARLSGHRLQVKISPAFVRANEVRSLHGSRTKIEKMIGQLHLIPLEETLRWMLDG